MVKEAIILAGGFGTRLQSVVSDLPKPMANVNGRPFLDYLLDYVVHSGIRKIVLSTGHMADKIEDHYGNKDWKKAALLYSCEHEPLGTGGAIAMAMQQCEDKEVLVLNGDSFFDVSLRDLNAKHSASNATHTLALRQVENASRYGAVEIDEHRIVSFREKSEVAAPGLINGGIYILNTDVYLMSTQSMSTFSIEKDFFEKELHRQMICGFAYKGKFIDIGTPEDYKRAQHEFKHFKY
jgi:D-glycero-alpha-D-manno-heptose 1-phosphate guanylyltransferase